MSMAGLINDNDSFFKQLVTGTRYGADANVTNAVDSIASDLISNDGSYEFSQALCDNDYIKQCREYIGSGNNQPLDFFGNLSQMGSRTSELNKNQYEIDNAMYQLMQLRGAGDEIDAASIRSLSDMTGAAVVSDMQHRNVSFIDSQTKIADYMKQAVQQEYQNNPMVLKSLPEDYIDKYNMPMTGERTFAVDLANKGFESVKNQYSNEQARYDELYANGQAGLKYNAMPANVNSQLAAATDLTVQQASFIQSQRSFGQFGQVQPMGQMNQPMQQPMFGQMQQPVFGQMPMSQMSFPTRQNMMFVQPYMQQQPQFMSFNIQEARPGQMPGMITQLQQPLQPVYCNDNMQWQGQNMQWQQQPQSQQNNFMSRFAKSDGMQTAMNRMQNTNINDFDPFDTM